MMYSRPPQWHAHLARDSLGGTPEPLWIQDDWNSCASVIGSFGGPCQSGWRPAARLLGCSSSRDEDAEVFNCARSGFHVGGNFYRDAARVSQLVGAQADRRIELRGRSHSDDAPARRL